MSEAITVLGYCFPYLHLRIIASGLSLVCKSLHEKGNEHIKTRNLTTQDIKDVTHYSTGASEKFIIKFSNLRPDIDLNEVLPFSCTKGYHDLFVSLVKHIEMKERVTNDILMKCVKMLWIHFQPRHTPDKLKQNFMAIQVELYNHKNMDLNEVLLEAIKLGLKENVINLLDHPKVNPAYENGLPLRMACSFPSEKIVKILLDHPAVNPAACNSEALLWATEQGNVGIVQILLDDKRADAFARDSYALRIAKESYARTSDLKYRRVMRVLQDHMATKNQELEEIRKMLEAKNREFMKRRKTVILERIKLERTYLNKEVLRNLFSWLNLPSEVFSMLLVCKSWRKFGKECCTKMEIGDGKLVSNLDDGKWHPFHKVVFRLKRTYGVKNANMWMIYCLSVRDLKIKNFKIFNLFPNLGDLRIHAQPDLTDEILAKELANLRSVHVDECHMILGETLGKMKHLRVLKVYRCEGFQSKMFCDCSLLQELVLYKVKRVNEEDLRGLRSLSSLTCVDVKMFSGIVIKDFGDQLEVFKFGDSTRLPDKAFEKMTNLRELTIENCKLVEGRIIPLNETLLVLKLSWCPKMSNQIFRSCPNVTDLEISLCDRINSSGLKYLKKLRRLKLDFCLALKDEIFSVLGNTLKRLEIKECGNIDGSGFVHLKNLTHLKLSRTTKITDAKLMYLRRLEVVQFEETGNINGLHLHTIGKAPKKKKKKKKKKRKSPKKGGLEHTEDEGLEELEDGELEDDVYEGNKIRIVKFDNFCGINKERVMKTFKGSRVKIVYITRIRRE